MITFNEWKQRRLQAKDAEKEFKPKFVMLALNAPQGYEAEIFVAPPRYARAVVINTDMGSVQFDSGEVRTEAAARKALIKALEQLEAIVAMRPKKENANESR